MEVTVIDNSSEVLSAKRAAVEKALTMIGIQAEKNAKTEITNSVYSTPASPNYKRTGRLRNSLAWNVEDETVYIGTNVEYAAYVELGTSRMGERPFLRPAVTNYMDEYRSILEKQLKGG